MLNHNVQQKKLFATLALLFVTFIWGSTFYVVQGAIQTVPPITFNAIRFLLSALLFLPVLLLYNKKSITISFRTWKFGIILGLFMCAGYLLQTIGLLYTSSTKAGFLTGLCVIFVPLFAWCKKTWKPNLVGVASIAFASLGLYLLSFQGAEQFVFGDLIVVGCAIAFALHILFTSEFTKIEHFIPLTWITMVTVALVSVFSALLFEDWRIAFRSELWSDSNFLFAMGVSVLLSTMLGFLVQTYAQSILSPIRVAIIIIFEPIFAAITGVVFAGDTLFLSNWIGAGFILLAMLGIELPSLKRKTLQ
ncbi:MAG: DMT family transporter [Bacilli bacterium]